MTPHEKLLAAIKARKAHGSFGLGIRLASDFVKTIQECVGVDACYKFAATKSTSWNDVMAKAAKTLVFTNEDMEVEEQLWEKVPGVEIRKLKGVKQIIDGEEITGDLELPKNTLMVFKHTLTSPRKDRDGDILRTRGAKPDPKMLLLWNHVHTLPIGKMLGVVEHTDKRLKNISAIVDVNELSHDAAVMIDNNMGRFSHGFRALDFVEMKSADGVESGGFDIKSFEIMEESLVSVPSNTDAEVDEVILSLVEGGKLKSPMMKAQGKQLREKRALRIPVTIDLKTVFNGQEVKGGVEQAVKQAIAGATTKGCGCGCGGTCGCKPKPSASEEADGEGADAKAEVAKSAKVADVEKCPDCGEPMKDGKCECGYAAKAFVAKPKDEDKDESEDDGDDEESKCPECGGELEDGVCEECGYEMPAKEKLVAAIHKHYSEQPRTPRGTWTNGRQILDKVAGIVSQFLEQLPSQVGSEAATETPVETPKAAKPSVKEAMSTVIALASAGERATLKAMLEMQDEIDQQHELASEYIALAGE